MLRERVIISLAAAVIGVVVFGLFKPVSPDPAEGIKSELTWFYLNKVHSADRHAGVILGDSRALRGLSTEAMAEVLEEPRFFNFAFESGGMNQEMYDAVDARLALGGDRTIVLAITPLAFLPWKTGNDQYREYLGKPLDQVLLYRHGRGFAEFFEPVSPSVIFRIWLGVEPQVMLRQTFHADGWIETDQTPDTVRLETERAYDRLADNLVSEDLIEGFMTRTRVWRRQGVAVFGVRPPSTSTMRALEDSLLGFDHEEFVERFEAAGGVWIPSAEDLLETYDGSHLRAADAREYSAAVAAAIGAN